MPNKTTKKPSRADVINLACVRIRAKSYLEIGVQTGKTFEAIDVVDKIGVDPDPYSLATLHITSDMFFQLNQRQYDVIFVDGLHHAEACYKDIRNALVCLNEGGIILVDDLVPTIEAHQTRQPSHIHWTGDVWKAWFRICSELDSEYECFIVDAAFGVGVIQKRSDTVAISDTRIWNFDNMDWKTYLRYKHLYHNIISIEELYEKWAK